MVEGSTDQTRFRERKVSKNHECLYSGASLQSLRCHSYTGYIYIYMDSFVTVAYLFSWGLSRAWQN